MQDFHFENILKKTCSAITMIHHDSMRLRSLLPNALLVFIIQGAACSVAVKLLDLDPQGRWLDPWYVSCLV